jgi:glycosyltransferase involved in cell wall biosynthesis
VSLIIPALNEAESIGHLLADTKFNQTQQVIVVDNGSTDHTAEIARVNGALVVQEPRRGYGYACAAGAAKAEYDILAFMDGDGSFVPAELPMLVAPIENQTADLVLGSRLINDLPPGTMPPHQLFGNRLISWMLNRIFALHLTDLGPFRALPKDLFDSLDMKELTYGWTVEMIIKIAKRGLRIVEVPVSYHSRFAGKSKVGGTLRGTILATYRIFSVVFRHAIKNFDANEKTSYSIF